MTKMAQPDPERSGPRRFGDGRPSPRGAGITVAVTERALGALVGLRAAEHALPGQALGLVVDPAGSIGLVLDLPGALDRVFSRNDTPILFIEVELGTRLAGRILDHDGTPGEERFTLDRIAPNVSPSDERLRRS